MIKGISLSTFTVVPPALVSATKYKVSQGRDHVYLREF